MTEIKEKKGFSFVEWMKASPTEKQRMREVISTHFASSLFENVKRCTHPMEINEKVPKWMNGLQFKVKHQYSLHPVQSPSPKVSRKSKKRKKESNLSSVDSLEFDHQHLAKLGDRGHLMYGSGEYPSELAALEAAAWCSDVASMRGSHDYQRNKYEEHVQTNEVYMGKNGNKNSPNFGHVGLFAARDLGKGTILGPVTKFTEDSSYTGSHEQAIINVTEGNLCNGHRQGDPVPARTLLSDMTRILEFTQSDNNNVIPHYIEFEKPLSYRHTDMSYGNKGFIYQEHESAFMDMMENHLVLEHPTNTLFHLINDYRSCGHERPNVAFKRMVIHGHWHTMVVVCEDIKQHQELVADFSQSEEVVDTNGNHSLLPPFKRKRDMAIFPMLDKAHADAVSAATNVDFANHEDKTA